MSCFSVGAFGNIGGKGTSELIRASGEVGNQFTHWFSWMFVVFTAATLIMQNHFLQNALARYDQGSSRIRGHLSSNRTMCVRAVIVVPIYYVSICMFSVLGGVLFFGEWDESSQMDLPQALLFLCGVAVIFYGVYLLTKDHLKVRCAYFVLGSSWLIIFVTAAGLVQGTADSRGWRWSAAVVPAHYSGLATGRSTVYVDSRLDRSSAYARWRGKHSQATC